MRKRIFGCLWILTLAISVNAQQSLTPGGQLAAMTWLEGEWTGIFGESPFWASYSSPQGGAILSLSKDLTPGREPCYIEFERFSYDDTSVYLVPYPGGVPHSLKFRLVDFDPMSKKATFRDVDNDWPTDLIYKRVDGDSLIITLTGPGEEGRPRTITARLGLVKGK